MKEMENFYRDLYTFNGDLEDNRLKLSTTTSKYQLTN